MTQMAVVLHYLTRADDPIIIGPFPSGEDASNWGFRHCEGIGVWHWLPLTTPNQYIVDQFKRAERERAQKGTRR